MRPKIIPGYKPNYITTYTRKGKPTIRCDYGNVKAASRDNRTHVCFDCRLTVRRRWHHSDLK